MLNVDRMRALLVLAIAVCAVSGCARCTSNKPEVVLNVVAKQYGSEWCPQEVQATVETCPDKLMDPDRVCLDLGQKISFHLVNENKAIIEQEFKLLFAKGEDPLKSSFGFRCQNGSAKGDLRCHVSCRANAGDHNYSVSVSNLCPRDPRIYVNQHK